MNSLLGFLHSDIAVGFQYLRDQNIAIDITLVAETNGETSTGIPAHKVVLMAGSDFFLARLSDRYPTTNRLNLDLQPAALLQVVDLMYGKDIDLQSLTFLQRFDLLTAVDFLLLRSIQKLTATSVSYPGTLEARQNIKQEDLVPFILEGTNMDHSISELLEAYKVFLPVDKPLSDYAADSIPDFEASQLKDIDYANLPEKWAQSLIDKLPTTWSALYAKKRYEESHPNTLATYEEFFYNLAPQIPDWIPTYFFTTEEIDIFERKHQRAVQEERNA